MKVLTKNNESFPDQRIDYIDPSDYRPEDKSLESFRNFVDSDLQSRVWNTYDKMHTQQCVEFVRGRMDKWCKFEIGRMGVLEVISKLDNLIDQSDPDIDLPNSVHAFQVAEKIREKHPDKEWLILTGLIHDAGKLIALHGEEQFATVGDTFPVGCRFDEAIVFGRESFKKNPDFEHPVYDTKYGIYSPNCGLDNITMSWGHDEYMYRVLSNCKENRLPQEGLDIIRFHSFYPWHTSGAYKHLCAPKDEAALMWVNEFNKFDLYTKSAVVPDIEALLPYYESLVEKFLPKVLSW